MTHRAFLPKWSLAAALLLAISACGGGGSDAASPPKVQPTTTLSAEPSQDAPSESLTSFEPNVGDRALRVGQTRQGKSAKMTLIEVKYPYPPAEYQEPEKGKQFVGLRVKQCVRADFSPADYEGEEFYSSYNGDWYAATPDGNQFGGSGSSWDDWPSPKFPENVTMNAGDCLKGWLALEVPVGTKIKKFVWRPGGSTTAEWLP